MGTNTVRFGCFEVQPEARQLLVSGVPAKLGARAFDVLLALIERPRSGRRQGRIA